MNDIRAKALALLNEVWKERGYPPEDKVRREDLPAHEALCRAIEQHEAYKQKVSDAIVSEYLYAEYAPERMQAFIIPKPKPDPLVEAIEQIPTSALTSAFVYAAKIRAALEAAGFEIREKGQ